SVLYCTFRPFPLFFIPLTLRLEVLGHQLLLQLTWCAFIMAKFHAELSFPLRCRPQIPAEAKHPVQTAVCINRKVVDPSLGVVDDGIPLVQQSNNSTLEFIRRRNHSLHQRLEDDR